ncbi:hypothetical protein PC9H_004447 [Pleurotus ostreatus]|uniref:Uncharacterized protein n=1 Tax=Pleurotus ostreatus TaxID=5322 RepID=A0A8H7A087_PLEOS|nr:uncharacterized protein PC9H_004447 [Pleurotus ostreatus]KAF7437605.1 hypothetical protein PC9H_004447 [Pleurotus ostreatus]
MEGCKSYGLSTHVVAGQAARVVNENVWWTEYMWRLHAWASWKATTLTARASWQPALMYTYSLWAHCARGIPGRPRAGFLAAHTDVGVDSDSVGFLAARADEACVGGYTRHTCTSKHMTVTVGRLAARAWLGVTVVYYFYTVPLHDISTLEGPSILAHDTTVLVSRFLLAHTAQSALETPAGDDKTKGGLAPQRGVLGSSADDTAPTTNTRYL